MYPCPLILSLKHVFFLTFLKSIYATSATYMLFTLDRCLSDVYIHSRALAPLVYVKINVLVFIDMLLNIFKLCHLSSGGELDIHLIPCGQHLRH